MGLIRPRSAVGIFWSTFVGMGFIFGLLVSLVPEVAPAEVVAYGSLFGLCSGILMGRLLRIQTITLSCEEPAIFLNRLKLCLAELDYHPESETENFVTFKAAFGILKGRISVHIAPSSLTVLGPKWYVQRLQRDLSK